MFRLTARTFFCIFFLLLPIILVFSTCTPEFKHQPVIEEPKLLFTKEPLAYPVEAFNLGIEGRTVIKLMIDPEGNIREATILESSGSHVLDESALRMAKSSVYEPGTIDGVPGEFELHIPVQFKLENTYDLIEDIDYWLEQTLIYQKELEADTVNIHELYEELFYHYQKLAREIGYTRSKDANETIMSFIDVALSQPWVEYQKKWPLGFLLYRDYMSRYPESEYQTNSLDGLIRYLEREKKILEHYTYTKQPYATIYSLILNELIDAYDQKQF